MSYLLKRSDTEKGGEREREMEKRDCTRQVSNHSAVGCGLTGFLPTMFQRLI
jgi:hypothetical protein